MDIVLLFSIHLSCYFFSCHIVSSHLSAAVVNANFVVPVEIDGVVHQVYVLKRPHCNEFLKRMGEMFECILFTASLSKVSMDKVD